jgi:hypothetical protein
MESEGGGILFEQARICIECNILYTGEILPGNFTDTTLRDKNYPRKDYHYIYIGEIINYLVKRDK